MNLLFSFILALGFLQSGFETEIEDQASFYLEEIKQGRDLTENHWALNELFQSTCSIDNSVLRLIMNSGNNKTKSYYTRVPCGNAADVAKLQRIETIALEEGLFGLTAYYLVVQNDPTKTNDFSEDFTETWGSSLNANQINLLRLLSNEIPFEPGLIFSSENSELLFFAIREQLKHDVLFPNYDFRKIAETWYLTHSEIYTRNDVRSSLQAANTLFLLFDLDRYQSIFNFLPVLSKNEYFPHSDSEMRNFRAMVYSSYQVGRYDGVLKILRDQLSPFANYLENSDYNDYNMSMMAISFHSLGKFQEAKEIYETLNQRNSSEVTKYVIYSNLGVSYERLGEKNKYISYQLNALSELEREVDPIDYKTAKLTILRNLFLYYLSIGDHQTALTYLETAEQTALDFNDTFEVAMIHVTAADYFWEVENDPKKALSELKTALQGIDINQNYSRYYSTVLKQADIYISIDSLDKAEVKLGELRDLALSKSDSPSYLEALIGLTEVSLLQNEYEQAKELLDEILVYPLDNIDFELLVKYKTVSSVYEFETGSKRKGVDALTPVIDQIINQARTNTDSQSGFLTMEDEYIDAFNAMVNMLIETGDTPKALQVLDEIKTINDAALYNSPVLRANKLSEEDLARDQLLNTQIQSLRTRYLNSETDAERFQIKSQIDRLSAQREEILNKLRTNLPAQTTPIWAVQRKLKSYEMSIHFTEVGDEFYISYITSKDVSIEKLAFNTEFRNLLSKSGDELASAKTNLKDLYSIYQSLNLESNIPEWVSSLTVIPDNYLYRIPLDILPVSEPQSEHSFGSVNYLIEDYNIQYFTSLSEYLGNTRNPSQKKKNSFAAFAISDFSNFINEELPSLPNATQEVREIENTLNSITEKRIYLQNEATKSSFISEASNSRIVHIATHSEVSEQDPLFSTIYLSENSGNSDSSALYAYELFETRMNSDFIMLNSCSSGSGSYLQGSGIMGISRALRYAGAKSLALNLWSVNDKVASDFATAFYSSINAGSTKAEAIRDAKLKLLKTGNANPHFWGAYMMIGNPSPLTEKPAKAGFLYPFLFALILAVSFSVRNSSI